MVIVMLQVEDDNNAKKPSLVEPVVALEKSV